MARQRFEARWFVGPDGVAAPRAKAVSSAMRRAVFDRDGWRCQNCHSQVSLLRPNVWPAPMRVGHADHIWPRALGGKTELENLRTLCERCNESRNYFAAGVS